MSDARTPPAGPERPAGPGRPAGAEHPPLPVLRLSAQDASLPDPDALASEIREAIDRYVDAIDLNDAQAMMAYGARCQQELDTFVNLALAQMMTKSDPAPIMNALDALCEAVLSTDAAKAAQGLFTRLTGGRTRAVRDAYRKAEPRVEQRANELTDLRVQLLRDQALFARLYEKNETLYRQLSAYVMCGRRKLGRTPESLERSRFERRVSDLEVTRTASLQLAAQLTLLTGTSRQVSDRIQATLTTTIPLWRAQMMTALGLADAQDAAAAQRSTQRALEGDLRAGARRMDRDARSGALDEAARQGEQLASELKEVRRMLLSARPQA